MSPPTSQADEAGISDREADRRDPARPDPGEEQPSFDENPAIDANGSDPVAKDPTIVPAPTPAPAGQAQNCLPVGGSTSAFDPGYIISDEVFYNSAAMSGGQVQAFVDRVGAGCSGVWCLRSLVVEVPGFAATEYCAAVPGGRLAASEALARISAACGINPQVMLTTLQKESGLLTRSDVSERSWAAAWGWHCPDTGPGGSANCDPRYAGFVNQLYGMASQWSRYRVEPERYNYRAGEVAQIMWNVAESGCGSAPVFIRNQATASLYNYTPYQPNAASLAAYPGEGDRCSAYGNRNFFVLFGKYFGGTGASLPPATAVTGTTVSIPVGAAVDPAGVGGVADTAASTVTIPSGPDVDPAVAGKRIVAPNPAVARGLTRGLAAVGIPYVWGGGTDGTGPDQGCSRGGGDLNSCQGIVGFDCSGFTKYVLRQAGFATGDNSGSQRAGGRSIPWSQAQPGDIIGYPGHVAIYLGAIDGVDYMVQAPQVGKNVQVRTVYKTNRGNPFDPVVHRFWS